MKKLFVISMMLIGGLLRARQAVRVRGLQPLRLAQQNLTLLVPLGRVERLRRSGGEKAQSQAS